MRAGSFPCDFCGSVLGLYCYPTDVPDVEWHACPLCVALIRGQRALSQLASGFRRTRATGQFSGSPQETADKGNPLLGRARSEG